MTDAPLPPPSLPELPDGPLEQRNAAGTVVFRGLCQAGKLEGEALFHDDDGHLLQNATYREGQLHGPLRAFENGRCRMESSYAFGRQEGLQRIYDPAGTLLAEIPHQSGLRHGLARFFDSQGQLVRQAAFAGGQLHGECLEFGPGGGLVGRSIFRQGLQEGEAQNFHPTGGLSRRQLFRDGKAVGPAIWLNPAGSVIPDPMLPRRSWWARLWTRE